MVMQSGLGLRKDEIISYVKTVLPIVIQQSRLGGWRGTSEIYFSRMAAWKQDAAARGALKGRPPMTREHFERLINGLFLSLAAALLWVVPYAVVTGLRSGFSKPAQKWELLKRVTTENPRLEYEHFPPISFDHGFPLAYKHFYVYAQDERVAKLALENGAIAGGVVLALFVALAVFLHVNRKSTLHGDARFGTLSEARRAGLAAPCGIILGRLHGQNLVSDDPGHVLIVGPTRTGKGVSFVIPNGLAWPGSMVTLDIKSENLKSFGAARAAKGDAVFVFAPGSTSSHRYNPLDYVRPGPEMATDCANIASFLVATGSVENEWTLARAQDRRGAARLCDDEHPFREGAAHTLGGAGHLDWARHRRCAQNHRRDRK